MNPRHCKPFFEKITQKNVAPGHNLRPPGYSACLGTALSDPPEAPAPQEQEILHIQNSRFKILHSKSLRKPPAAPERDSVSYLLVSSRALRLRVFACYAHTGTALPKDLPPWRACGPAPAVRRDGGVGARCPDEFFEKIAHVSQRLQKPLINGCRFIRSPPVITNER